MAKAGYALVSENFPLDTIHNSACVLRYMQETTTSLADESTLSEDARMGMFMLLGMVADALEEANHSLEKNANASGL